MRSQRKKNSVYKSYSVPDYSSRKRKLWTFADLSEAKEKATEIAEATQYGKSEILNWEEGLRAEIRKSLDAVKPTGLSILPACQLFSQAVQMLGGKSDELLAACQHYVLHRPGKPFTPKLAKDAAREFLATKKLKISARRLRALSSCVNRFAEEFKVKALHEIDQTELKDYVDLHVWAPKTHNDFLGAVSLLYKEAEFRNWVPAGYNPAKNIERRKVIIPSALVFEPHEAKTILNRIDAELVPMLALWFFGGIRKEEISRMNWQQVNSGLKTGWIFIEAKQTKTGVDRSVPVSENLKQWLLKHQKSDGYITPDHWRPMAKLDELPNYVARKTGVVWKGNAPRHSFGTYYLKICKDPGEVVKAMGNSLHEFEKHYWCKAKSITEETAKAWFDIRPNDAEPVPVVQETPVRKVTLYRPRPTRSSTQTQIALA